MKEWKKDLIKNILSEKKNKRTFSVLKRQLKKVLDKKIKIIQTNRGGKITLHNPGQKIVYFVIMVILERFLVI